MGITQHKVNQKILETTTYLQADLEATLAYVLEQAGSKLKIERREEFQRIIEDTKRLLEYLKSRYV